MPLGALPLTEAVAQTLYRLMAIKDEYEVARLYTDGRFLKQLSDQFEGDLKRASTWPRRFWPSGTRRPGT